MANDLFKILFATNNDGKLREAKAILSGFDVMGLKDAGIDVEVDETGETFEENALLKAAELCRLTGGIVLADDSGLEINALDGFPGVKSARFMAEYDYAAKNAELIRRLEGAGDRSARYVCVAALAFPTANGVETRTARGEVEGEIAFEPEGENGFGYDPIFVVKELGATAAELPSDVKNGLSHRGKAFRAIRGEIIKVLNNG